MLFVTGHAPADRVGAFERLHLREGVTYALYGGRSRHAGARSHDLNAPHESVSQGEVYGLAASGRFRAVVCGTGGRTALPAAVLGARRSGAPFLLWSSLWAHPRSAVHGASYLPLRRLYATAAAVVTYGAHVSAYVRARGARNVHIAPQAVDNEFWGARPSPVGLGVPWPEGAPPRFMALFVGRGAREKGVRVLHRAWRASGLATPVAALVLVGVETGPPRTLAGGAATSSVICAGCLDPAQVRNFYGAANVLIVPSIPTRTFLEPWGLVVNEAMNQGLPVISSDAVGAAAGGLVRHGRNGLIVPAGDPGRLAAAVLRLQGDPDECARLGQAARRDVAAYTQDAWAAGFSGALATVAAAREP